jgi:hypothetical protein
LKILKYSQKWHGRFRNLVSLEMVCKNDDDSSTIQECMG